MADVHHPKGECHGTSSDDFGPSAVLAQGFHLLLMPQTHAALVVVMVVAMAAALAGHMGGSFGGGHALALVEPHELLRRRAWSGFGARPVALVQIASRISPRPLWRRTARFAGGGNYDYGLRVATMLSCTHTATPYYCDY